MFGQKAHITVALVGHSHSGKSALCGRLMYELGGMSERELQKLKKEASERGKEEELFSFYLDRTKEERERGMSICNQSREFFNANYHYTIIDTPGHRKYTKTMIRAVSQSDVAVLVVSAKDYTSSLHQQTYQKALICHALGVETLMVCINKMDDEAVGFDQDIFEGIKSKLSASLSAIGFSVDTIPFIPLCGWKSINVVGTHSESKMSWFEGDPLLNALDFMEPPKRYIGGPAIMYLYEVHMIKGVGLVLTGAVKQGVLETGDAITYGPQRNAAKVFSVEQHHKNMEKGECGDCIGINIKGWKQRAKVGDVVMTKTPQRISSAVRFFTATILVDYHPNKMKIGCEVNMHLVTKRVQCALLSIHWKKGKEAQQENEESVEKWPDFLGMQLIQFGDGFVWFSLDRKWRNSGSGI